MKATRNYFIIILVFWAFLATSQSPVGMWENYHPDKGTPLSHIEFFEEDGSLNARVLEILDEEMPPVCEACTGARRNKELPGMVVIWNLKPGKKSKWKKGRILDPGSGKIYKCFVQLLSDDRMKVRGYLGFKALGKTQYWSRVEESNAMHDSGASVGDSISGQ